MFRFIENMTLKISDLIRSGAHSGMSDKQFLEKEIIRWKSSPKRIMQIKGHAYFEGEHEILTRKRKAIGEDGELQEVTNLPNNHIVDNQYGKIVNQKANYLLGKPITFKGDDEKYIELLTDIFDKRFMRTIKNAGKAMLNGGIAWLYPYYNSNGDFTFRLFPSYEILPFWKDSEHTTLDMAVRLYQVEGYEGTAPVIIEKVEVYDRDGIHYFVLDGETLIPDIVNRDKTHSEYLITTDDNGKIQTFNWQRIPLIPLKYNELETPLLKKVKSLQDGINVMLSDFENNMQEDARNTILILRNYDGENLGEFRHNLMTYGAVKVISTNDEKGGVDALQITVNADNYKSIVEIFKKALIENAMGYDAKDDRLSGNPNQMNIQSMYSDIDLDANDIETELQAAFDDILFFVNAHLSNMGKGDFDGENVQVIFDRDILINESEAIANCAASVGIISEETIVSQHPWVDDPQEELKRLEKQRQKVQEQMEADGYDPFGKPPDNKSGDDK